jgi:hypothetical protein
MASWLILEVERVDAAAVEAGGGAVDDRAKMP